MKKANLTLLLLVGALLPAAAVAEDAGLSSEDDDRLPITATSIESLQLVSRYSSRWQLSYPVEETAFSRDAAALISDIEFSNPGALARVSKVRELSLLTLAEVGHTRLFLGVSENGLLGFHLGALPRLGDERCLEVARMPYLKNDQQAESPE